MAKCENNCSEKKTDRTSFLIINADDYGYFPGVSRGIIECAKQGVISATGILSNSPYLDQHLKWLDEVRGLNTGLHLNLTHGRPLTSRMQSVFSKWNGNFAGKGLLSLGILTRQIRLADVIEECRAQILRCLNAGLKLCFINSHEHIHMLPSLFSKTLELADEYSIPWVRDSRPEWGVGSGMGINPGGILRDMLLRIMRILNRQQCLQRKSPELAGMRESGKLTYPYLQKRFGSFQPGKVYELMCHPGYMEPPQTDYPQLIAYHDWEGELKLLQSKEFREMCRLHRIELIHYRDLT